MFNTVVSVGSNLGRGCCLSCDGVHASVLVPATGSGHPRGHHAPRPAQAAVHGNRYRNCVLARLSANKLGWILQTKRKIFECQ